MALLERVATLLRANLNDMIDKAEDPAKLLKQLVLDMENQLLQVKTQVAIAMADQYVLEARTKEHEDAVASWRSKAELALKRDDEPLARAALERSLQSEQLRSGYAQQLEDQRLEADTLRTHYGQLEAKLADTSAQAELLLQQHRRTRRDPAINAVNTQRALTRMRAAITHQRAATQAERKLQADSANAVDDRLRTMEREERVEALLQELKSRPRLLQG